MRASTHDVILTAPPPVEKHPRAARIGALGREAGERWQPCSSATVGSRRAGSFLPRKHPLDCAAVAVDAEVIERAFLGDRGAQRKLGERLLPVIRAAVIRRLFCFARAQARDGASERDDLVHGVWLRMFENDWRALRAFDSSRGSLEAYVSTIADRHVLSVFRVKSSDPYTDVPMDEASLDQASPPEFGVESRIWARAELHDLYQFLQQRLDERGILLFHLLEIDGLPVEEVCAHAEMSRAALYQWRARLRKIISQWRSEHS